MTLGVTDSRSNANDQIAHAVAIIGRSKHRADVFRAIYFGKQKTKTVDEIAATTRLPAKRVLEEAKKLSSNDIVHQDKEKGKTCYGKDKFYSAQKGKILTLVENPQKLKKLPTKTRPIPHATNTQIIKLPGKSFQISQITIDEINSFSKVKKIGHDASPIAMAEKQFKEGVMKILGEKGKFQDWGGEKNDLCTTRFNLNGRRRTVAFAFKGKGLKKKLTPALMGKNGDQIQRLFQTPAEIFLLQYWAHIEDSVLEQMQMAAKVRSYSDGRRIYYGIIDGQDSARLIQAYPKHFKKLN
jgi:DNA-binding transcriptional regulator GbsR (MarR family)